MVRQLVDPRPRDEPLAVDEPDALPGDGERDLLHLGDCEGEEVRHAAAGLAGAGEEVGVVGEGAADDRERGDEAAEHRGGGALRAGRRRCEALDTVKAVCRRRRRAGAKQTWATKRGAGAGGGNSRRSRLDVVVEHRGAAAVLVEEAEAVGVAKVLELEQDRLAEAALGGGDELVDELVVRVAADALVAEADVEGVFQQGLGVGTGVDADGEGEGRVEPAVRRVALHFTHGDAHALDAQVAQPEHALAVGEADELHVALRPVLEHRVDAPAVRHRDEEAPRAAEEEAVLEARLPDRRAVDDGLQLLGIVHQHPVEEALVALLEAHQEGVLLERRGEGRKVGHDALDLERLGHLGGGEEACAVEGRERWGAQGVEKEGRDRPGSARGAREGLGGAGGGPARSCGKRGAAEPGRPGRARAAWHPAFEGDGRR